MEFFRVFGEIGTLLASLARLWAYVTTAIAMLFAIAAWQIFAVAPSGMRLLLLVVGTLFFATWLGAPQTRWQELRRSPLKFTGRTTAILAAALVCCAAVASVHATYGFSVVNTAMTWHFAWNNESLMPGVLAAALIATFFLAVSVYPYTLRTDTISEWMTLCGIVIGFAGYLTSGIMWLAIAMAIIARWISVAICFYRPGGFARASLPPIDRRLF